ncbi:MAG: isoprenylcysteine carboxylmethyltransferase family protein [Planctomycetia bacterium]|nr:isoprenylcysteine carboxylmethyltransferase family protein [Planctomycetia bacterium]
MSQVTRSAAGQISVTRSSSTLHSLAQFLIRRRIILSAILFGMLVVHDIAFGSKPRDLANFRDPYSAIGGSLVLFGLALRSWAVGVLRKDAELTTSGPYRLIRNPLYVGSFLMMFGFCALIDDPKNIWLLLGPILIMYTIKVRQEERTLSALFPAAWADYVRMTPRFFPWIGRADLAAHWSAEQWIRSREYHALLATVAALVAIKIWQLS